MTPTHDTSSQFSDELGIYAEDQSMTSIVSYPKRCNQWGSPSFRGNCDGQLFKNLVLRYKAKRVADPMMGSGTTKDVIAGLNRRRQDKIHFWGADLHSGFDLATDAMPGHFDFIWIHPPYWNIVRYNEKDTRDLSTCHSYDDFLYRLRHCLTCCRDALAPNGRLAVLVGDIRRQGQYYSIIRDVLTMEPDLGQLRSVIVKAQHNCWSDRKQCMRLEDVPIKHEYCAVFKNIR